MQTFGHKESGMKTDMNVLEGNSSPFVTCDRDVGTTDGSTRQVRRHPTSSTSLNSAKSMTTRAWIFVSQAQFQRKIGLYKTSICGAEQDGLKQDLTYDFPLELNN